MFRESKAIMYLGAAFAVVGASIAQAQNYPSKPVTLVVGYTAGGQADVLARKVGDRLAQKLGTPVIIENLPGANGLLGAQKVAGAKPDGYTLALATDSMLTVEPQLAEGSKWNPLDHMEPVARLAEASLFVVANTSFKPNTIAEMVDYAKTSGEKLSFGSSGPSSPHRLAGEDIQKRAGFSMIHVPYPGTSASMTDLAGGQITLAFGALTSIQPLMDAGKLKLIAATSKQRSRFKPDVPAVAETWPGFDYSIYYGIITPKGTPKDVVEKLNGSINEVLKEPETINALNALGVSPSAGSPDDFRSVITADYETRGKILGDLGLKAK
ncbi:Bug family tripartite tricarboxylate transporter substrate binding protein [Rhizobium puerariae]|uniref:Bug family tripartite tricarboxylate transporter substrate binding protein n=1 Tax=Rhizobium puerariae TaxID=1585791 RepID=A0ABV6ALF5_9HYPH